MFNVSLSYIHNCYWIGIVPICIKDKDSTMSICVFINKI